MPTKLLDIEAFRAGARAGAEPGATFKLSTAEPQMVTGASSRTRRFVFSDATIDHANDVIRQDGWDLSVFARNPVALFGHDASALPIGKASNVMVRNNKLIGDIEFCDAETYPFADTVFRLVKGGFLKAVSVGFLPKDWKFTSDKNRPNGLDFIKQMLIEISVCPVPANPSALIEARAAGIDVRSLRSWAERVLDGEEASPLARRDLEMLRSQAAEPRGGRIVRSASGSALDQVCSAVGASIGDTRQAITTVQGIMASSDEPKLDEAQLKMAVGHFAGAITSKNAALACLRAAMASAAGDFGAPDPSEPQPGDPGARSVAERLREARELQRSFAAETPAERLQKATALKRELSTPTKTRTERLIEAADIKRRLAAEGL